IQKRTALGCEVSLPGTVCVNTAGHCQAVQAETLWHCLYHRWQTEKRAANRPQTCSHCSEAGQKPQQTEVLSFYGTNKNTRYGQPYRVFFILQKPFSKRRKGA